MKKKIIIAVVVLIVMLLLTPIPSKMKDGGTTHYNAILYDIYDVHRIKSPLEWTDSIEDNEYIEGTIIKVLGFEVFNNIEPQLKC